MRKRKNSRRVTNLLVLLLFLAGAGLILYPTISDMWNTYRNARLLTEYSESVKQLDSDRYKEIWQQAKKYNENHTVNKMADAFDEKNEYELSHPYDIMLDPNGDGLMGSIEIPKINLRLAIYHGLGKDALEKGCGHVEGTSLPIGGKGTHAVLAAHRGLPSAKLFTDLDQLEKGDIFVLNILDRKLAYEVDQIETVLPDATGALAIVEDKDYVTLLTCTPYAVNTHRLLVRGKRTKYVEEENVQMETLPEIAAAVDPRKLLAVGVGVFMGVTLVLFLIFRRKKGGAEDEK